MDRRLAKVRTWLTIASLAAAAVLAVGSAARAQAPAGPKLEVSAATSVDRVRPGDSFDIAVVLRLPEGTHVNAHAASEPDLIPTEVKIAAPKGVRVGSITYPAGEQRSFPFTPKPIAVYEGEVLLRAPATAGKELKPGRLLLEGSLSAQPCTDLSCFPPTTIKFSLPLEIAPAGTPVKPAHPELFRAGGTAADIGPAGTAGTTHEPHSTAPSGSRAHYPRLNRFVTAGDFLQWLEQGGTQEERSRLGDLIRGGNWLIALPLIFLAGLALNLTPCVYPLIPITIGFFGGQSGGSRRQVITLASVYVLGMAVMYSSLGVAAAMTNQLFGNQLQNPYVLGGFAAVMFALGLSMFGLWEFRVPAGLASRVSGRTGPAGALIMGLLVGFVAAPCIGPVVVALLQVVGSMGSPAVGFGVFFALALGLGTPYLLLGIFSGLIQRLPRSGEWMNAVKHIFGLVMFGMALYYLSPLLGERIYPYVIALYTLAAGAYLALLDPAGRSLRRFFAAKRSFGVAAIVAGAAMLLPQQQHAEIPFEPYSEQKVQDAVAQGRGVLVDFRADWCAACRELEAKTFRDARVVAAVRGLVVLRKDMTRWDDPEARRLKDDYGIVGLPTVVLIPPRN